jgi:hypothetical protein
MNDYYAGNGVVWDRLTGNIVHDTSTTYDTTSGPIVTNVGRKEFLPFDPFSIEEDGGINIEFTEPQELEKEAREPDELLEWLKN